MAITILLYPYNEVEQRYEDDVVKALPLTFGEMTIEYYNTIAESYAKAHDLGFYMDNVIRRGTNVFEAFCEPDMLNSDWGFTSTDFTKVVNDDTRKEKYTLYKISDVVYANVYQTIRINPRNKNEGKAYIYPHFSITFYLSNDGGVTQSQSISFSVSTSMRLPNALTYSEFLSFNGGYNIMSWFPKQGFILGINAYPLQSRLVEASKTTTGCLMQEYTIFRDIDTNELKTYTPQAKCMGIQGSVVQPYGVSSWEQIMVPLVLGNGYEVEFPESETDSFIGGYDNSSDGGGVPDLPLQSAVSSGMVRLYQMTTTQLQQFASFLWNTSLTEWDSFINTLKQWFENPLDSIISLSISPIDYFHDYKENKTDKPEETNIRLTTFDTGVKGLLCSSNYKQISLGTLNLKPYYKSFLDCNPHTKFSLYLPYIGFKDIDADVLFSSGATAIEVVYSVDLITGVCVANVLIDKDSRNTHLKHVLYTFAGNMNTTIPITSANMRDFLSASVGAVASAVAIGATGGAVTPLLAGSMAIQAGMGVASQKVNISHSGGMSLEAGMFGIQYAYLVVTRPREARPKYYKDVNGLPSEVGGNLSNYAGFTQVSSVHVNIEGATDEEKNEIEKLLKAGVIL